MNRPAANLALLLNLAQGVPQRPRVSIHKPERRGFVFLQGPPGPLLHELAHAMRGKGIKVERINV